MGRFLIKFVMVGLGGMIVLSVVLVGFASFMSERDKKQQAAAREDRLQADWKAFEPKRAEVMGAARAALQKGDTREVERLIGRFHKIGDDEVTGVLNESRELAAAKRKEAELKAKMESDKRFAQQVAERQKALNLSDAALCREIKKASASEGVLEAYKMRGGSPDLRGVIRDGKVRIGMRALDARCAWGAPEDINRTTGATYTHEQWVYASGNYLYFDDGVLSTVQN